MRSLALLVPVLAVLAAAAPAAEAQLYRWTNDRGEVHLTQGIDSVPERYRAGATLVGFPEAGPRAADDGASGVLARIPYVPGAPIVVTAQLNGGRAVRLLLDTGAARTVIAPRALTAARVDLRPTGRARVLGVGGTAEAPAVTLESLGVGAARVGPLEVLALDAGLSQGDGLLGRDFLERFALVIDSRARVVTLGRR